MLDINKRVQKKDFITVDNEKYYFKNLRPYQKTEAMNMVQKISVMEHNTEEDDEKAMEAAREYIHFIIEIPEDIVLQFDFDTFEMIQQYVIRKPYFDQGFTEKEIQRIEKRFLMDGLEGKNPLQGLQNMRG